MLQHNSLSLVSLALTTLLCSSIGSSAAPVDPRDFFLPTPGITLRPRVEAGDFFLRVMPLGASITAGQGSEDDNGYRKFLRDALRADGWKVNMVGNKDYGDMKDNQAAAVPGFTIDQVHGLANDSIKYQPNLVLINAGTNDMVQNKDLGNAPKRMENLLDHLYSSIPGVTVLLSTLLPSNDDDLGQRTPAYNQALRDIVVKRNEAGQSIVLADMSDGRIDPNTLPDDIHPDDSGYQIMSDIWLEAFEKATAVQAPNDTEWPDELEDDA